MRVGDLPLAQSMLAWIGNGAIKTAIASILAMLALLPLMVLTALIFVATIAMPVINRHVSAKFHSDLAKHHGGSLWGMLKVSVSSLIVFVILWVVTLPLAFVPPIAFLLHPLLWGWLTYQVMAYDALAEHATQDERRQLIQKHRWPLLAIGTAIGALGMVPTLLWLGGALSLLLFPLLTAVAVWLYVALFVFSGLWFQHYSLEALAQLRSVADSSIRLFPGSLTISADPIHLTEKP